MFIDLLAFDPRRATCACSALHRDDGLTVYSVFEVGKDDGGMWVAYAEEEGDPLGDPDDFGTRLWNVNERHAPPPPPRVRERPGEEAPDD